MEKSLTCSICFEKFSYPVVINCGHTFDKACIKHLESCPVCRKPIKCKIINWELVSYMNLNIKQKIEQDLMCRIQRNFIEVVLPGYTASQLKSTDITNLLTGRKIVYIIKENVYHDRGIRKAYFYKYHYVIS